METSHPKQTSWFQLSGPGLGFEVTATMDTINDRPIADADRPPEDAREVSVTAPVLVVHFPAAPVRVGRVIRARPVAPPPVIRVFRGRVTLPR